MQIYLIIILILVPLLPASAAVIDDLYQGKILVENQSAKSRQVALRSALAQVLVKITGSNSYLEQRETKQLLNSASQYLAGYTYSIQDSQQYYVADFDEQKVNTAVKRAGLPIWGKRRPDTLVWMAYQADLDNFERQLIDESNSGLLQQALNRTANKRGIQIRLPIMDLTDRGSIGVFDIWNEALQTVSEASTKYSTDYVLSLRLFPQSIDSQHSLVENETPYVFLDEEKLLALGLSKQELSWQYFLQQQALKEVNKPAKSNLPWKLEWSHFNPKNLNSFRSGNLFANSPEQALEELVELIADMMGSEFALELTASGGTSVLISLNGIDSLTDYKNSIAFLEGLIVVDQARLLNIQGSQVKLELVLTGAEQDLRNTLSLDERISLSLNEYGEEVEELDYNWVAK